MAISKFPVENDLILKSTPETTHWGYLDATIDPVLEISTGASVRIECVSGNPEWMPKITDRRFTPLPELLDIHRRSTRDIGNHILTGPIYIHDAQVGDVLAVHITDINFREPWGYNMSRPYIGTLPERFPNHHLAHIPLDISREVALLPSGLEVPLSPFFGQLVVAPPRKFGRQGSKEPREYGGNIDCKDIVSGSVIFLPVWNEGALFSVGDGHAVQGNGEVNGSALETSLEGVFEFHVVKNLGWTMPRALTPSHLVTFGFDVDLDAAARQALSDMLDWLIDLTRLNAEEAYMLASFAVDLEITQTVNNVKGVHAKLRRSVLKNEQPKYF